MIFLFMKKKKKTVQVAAEGNALNMKEQIKQSAKGGGEQA